eukprot:2557080-Pyramimonas_sp.AAC.1
MLAASVDHWSASGPRCQPGLCCAICCMASSGSPQSRPCGTGRAAWHSTALTRKFLKGCVAIHSYSVAPNARTYLRCMALHSTARHCIAWHSIALAQVVAKRCIANRTTMYCNSLRGTT